MYIYIYIYIYSICVAKPGSLVEDLDLQGFMHDGFHDVWLLFVLDVGFSLFPYSYFGFHCLSFGSHLGPVCVSSGLHFHSIGHPKAAWDKKWSRKASRSEKCEFPEPSPPHSPLPLWLIFRPCTWIFWLYVYLICMSDFFAIFHRFLNPWKSENHLKPLEMHRTIDIQWNPS